MMYNIQNTIQLYDTIQVCPNQAGYKGAALGVALSRTRTLCKTSL